MRIIREQTAAVLVDVQDRLFPHMFERDTLQHNLSILIRGLEVLDIPLLVTQQYTKGLGPTIPSIRETLGWAADPGSTPTEKPSVGTPSVAKPYIEKIAFSCWDEPAFRQAFTALDRPRVLLAGIESHVCVLQTAIDLNEAGFTPIVIENCTSSRRETDKRVAFLRLQAEGILVSTYESILFELAREAGSDTFRAVSRLVK
ncbi:MAG: isochorismatase family protein [Spirochaetaceae bacterium]|nr:MAG: isochorismatase family protein [Spirochaetaceae bacterium]